MPNNNDVSQVKEAQKATILGKDNVVGVGVGYKVVGGQVTSDRCVQVLVNRKISRDGLSSDALVAREVDGVPTDVVQVGELRALVDRTGRFRPAPGGVSIGHYQISAGTLGAIVKDRATGVRLILSNNHVLANSNNAAPGDPIIQPGGADGGNVNDDLIAHLERFCEITFNTDPGTGGCSFAASYVALGNFLATMVGSRYRVMAGQVNRQATNLADAAVARPVNDSDVLDEILEIGTPTGTTTGELGMAVRKSGRTTELTTGTINTIEATVSVNYGSGRVATFENQFVAGPMSQGGDSGSLVLAQDSLEAVGLLFAGSNQSTIFNPIQAVLDCLNVDF